MISLYNTLAKRKEIFEPLYPGKVGMYVCGPTVYDYTHIGNLKAYILPDLLRRLLEYTGYEVRMIKNITDVGHLTADTLAQADSGEDKIEQAAKVEKKTPEEIARFYEGYFRETEKKMNILPAHYFPRATAHIPQMIKLIETLITKGHAYTVNGNVFLDVTSFPDYGKLSGNTLEKLKVGARLEEHPDKRHQWDFALWLKAPKEHVMKWESPWGVGYPGWHIECSAMSLEYLGDTFDIHTGGEDHIFPHHEAEIIQSEGASGKPFVRYWLHTRHMLIDGVKMSKSKGNFYTLEDIVAKGYTPMDLRLALLSGHYRSPMNFTWGALNQAQTNWHTLENFHDRLNNEIELRITNYELRKTTTETTYNIEKYQEDFLTALNDDLNTPEALSILLALVSEGNKLLDEKSLAHPETVRDAFDLFVEKLLGMQWESRVAVPEHIKQLAKERQTAREQKKYAEADRLRVEIEGAGYLVEDTPRGSKVKRH